MIEGADLWLTPRVVEGFDAGEFPEWPEDEREDLRKEVEAFLAIAGKVPPDKPATKAQSLGARKHLERAIQIVRRRLLDEWLEALRTMMDEAAAAANERGWYVELDEKEVRESLLGTYRAPRLLIRTRDQGVVLVPVARFGSGRKGVVDLDVMPTYETAYLITFSDGHWRIASATGTAHSRPLSRTTLINTITKLPHS